MGCKGKGDRNIRGRDGHDMSQEKKYTISTETKYIKEYQNEHYRALILDENGRKIRFGRRWFLSEEQAFREGELLLEELHKAEKLAEYGIHFTRGVFNDENGSGRRHDLGFCFWKFDRVSAGYADSHRVDGVSLRESVQLWRKYGVLCAL